MNWDQLLAIIFGSSLIAALATKVFDFFTEKRKNEEEKYQKLYGSLTYKLLLMKIITNNQKDLVKEIKDSLNNPEERIQAYGQNINPLVKKWITCKDDIKELFETYPGYIKKEHILLVSDFLDGCIKREIIEDGKNQWTNEKRIEKLLSAIKALEDKILKY